MKLLTLRRKVLLEIAMVDFMLTFVVLYIFRIFHSGVHFRFEYVLTTSLVWVLVGVLTSKLHFWSFSKRKKALLSIVVIDVLVYFSFFAIWKLIFSAQGQLFFQLGPLPIIMALECWFYLTWCHIEYNVQCLISSVEETPYKESGIDNAPKYLDNENQNKDLEAIYEHARTMSVKECGRWIYEHQQQFSSKALVLKKGEGELLQNYKGSLDLIVCMEPFNRFHHFNYFVRKANEALVEGGTILVYGETSGMRRHRIFHDYPKSIAYVIAAVDYLWSRVLPKLVVTHKFYMMVTKGRHRNFPRVEVMGRFAKAGFDICGDEIVNNTYFLAAAKCRKPVSSHPAYGVLVRLPRKGKNGKMIGVYKLRTMYAYSEFIQDYTYKINGLEEGGKIKNDFRVNMVGSICRSRFLDEVPMFINLFKGDLKFVGVRPLSQHYLSLYTPEMQKMHLSVKPGIFPPFYYEYPKPKTIEEVQESERRYIESYLKHPRHTDWVYFWGMVRNIVFRRERSH